MNKQELTKEVSKILGEMIRPVAKDMATDILNNSGINGTGTLIEGIKK
ncbi:MAG: hypothetical protein Q8K30_06765 [Candidatus Gracilibacteria bacterium]|nr:hypothetical protein [Candidatus Gracilibacteria bacterium]